MTLRISWGLRSGSQLSSVAPQTRNPYEFRTYRLCLTYGECSRLTAMTGSHAQRVGAPGKANATLLHALVFLSLACLFAVFLSWAVGAPPRATSRRTLQAGPQAFPVPATRDSQGPETPGEGFQDTARSAGQSPLDGVAVVEQAIAPSTRYTIHLWLDSGAEQFIVVTAPPGGLLLEVRDMTGDNVRNDLVLKPALVRGPLNVLLNDGQDHFTLATSGALSDSWETDGKQVSGTHGPQEAAALASSRFDAGSLAHPRRLSLPQFQPTFLSPIAQIPLMRSDRTACASRAPPTLATQISWRVPKRRPEPVRARWACIQQPRKARSTRGKRRAFEHLRGGLGGRL
jgi:hypothetical protein